MLAHDPGSTALRHGCERLTYKLNMLIAILKKFSVGTVSKTFRAFELIFPKNLQRLSKAISNYDYSDIDDIQNSTECIFFERSGGLAF